MSEKSKNNQEQRLDALIHNALHAMTPPVDAAKAKHEFIRRAHLRFPASEEPYPWSVLLWRHWRSMGTGLAYAACLAALMGYFAWRNPISERLDLARSSGVMQRAVEAIRIGAGSNARFAAGDVFRLQDGTRVECLTPTTLSVIFSASERRIRLHDGALEIHAATNVFAPFRVETSDARVTVTGTRFIVSTRMNGGLPY